MFEADDSRIIVTVQKPILVEMIYCSSCFRHFGCKVDGNISFCNRQNGKCFLGCPNKEDSQLKLTFGECSECYSGNSGSFFILEEGLCIL